MISSQITKMNAQKMIAFSGSECILKSFHTCT
jgi:hypothetical protein